MRLSNLQIVMLCSAAFAPPREPIDFVGAVDRLRSDSAIIPIDFRRGHGAGAYPLPALVAKSRQWRRARRTHRHKRK